jgi:hypothetical protein
MTYAMPFQKYVKTVLRVAASSAARAEQPWTQKIKYRVGSAIH